MHAVLDIKTIENEILPYLTKAKRGYATKANLAEVVNAILYKLKSGCQWRMLPVDSLFSETVIGWNAVFHHFRKWAVNGDWANMYANVLANNKRCLDLSVTHTDGSHTRAVRGGEAVEYQGRKSSCTVNSIYFSDAQGIPLGMSEPMAGNHNDLHGIEASMTTIFTFLALAGISVDGLFNNADQGFDGKKFRKVCEDNGVIANVPVNHRNGSLGEDCYYDDLLYQERFVIERTNAWMDSYRSVLNRFDTTVDSWRGWNYLAFAVILLKKVNKRKV